MKKMVKYLLSGVAALIGVVAPQTVDVTSKGADIGLASTIVEASADSLNTEVFEFTDRYVGFTDYDYASTLDYEFSYYPDNVTEKAKTDEAFNHNFNVNISDTKNRSYLYRFTFYKFEEAVVTYSFLYTEDKIYGFADCLHSSFLTEYRVDGLGLDLWKTDPMGKTGLWKDYLLFGEGALKVVNACCEAGYLMEGSFNYYFEIENNVNGKSVSSPFAFEDSIENVGKLYLHFNDVSLDDECMVNFSFGYFHSSLFVRPKAVLLNCTGCVYSSETDFGVDNQTLRSVMSSYKTEYDTVLKDLDVTDPLWETFAEKCRQKDVEKWYDFLRRYFDGGNYETEILVCFLQQIEGTPFARRVFGFVPVSLDFDVSDYSSAMIVNAFKSKYKNILPSLNVMNCTPVAAEKVDVAYYFNGNQELKAYKLGVGSVDSYFSYEALIEYNGNIIEKDLGELMKDLGYSVVPSYYMIRYYGGQNITLTAENGNKGYISLDINSSFAEFYYDKTYALQELNAYGQVSDKIKYQAKGLSSYLTGMDDSDLISGLYSQILSMYEEELQTISPTELYGFWGFGVAPRLLGMNSFFRKTFDTKNVLMSSALVGQVFKNQVIEYSDSENLLQNYGYTPFTQLLHFFGNLVVGSKAEVVAFFVTDYDDALNKYISFNGSLDVNDENSLWINTMQQWKDEFLESRGWKIFASGLGILYISILIFVFVYIVSWVITICKSIFPSEAELNARSVTYNLDNSSYDSHNQTEDYSDRTYYNANDSYHGDTFIEGGAKDNHANYNIENDNYDEHGTTTIYSSGSRYDHSQRKSYQEIHNAGSTTVDARGERYDRSNRTSYNTQNNSKTGVNASGNRYDQSNRTSYNTQYDSRTMVDARGERYDQSNRTSTNTINNNGRPTYKR